MNKSEFYKELYNLYGPVTRGRNCFLYTKKGIRITDCYQENGRAILGWDAGNAFTFLKNTLSRGQNGSFICEDSSRVAKAVSKLLNSERKVLYFSSKTDALKAGLSVSQSSTSVYIPWAPQNLSYENTDAIIITPPLPWTDTVYILAVKTELKVPGFEQEITIPFSLQAGITRAIYNLIDALNKREEKNWFIYDTILTKYWERKGPYLYSKIPQKNYDNFVVHCLKLGIAINPDYNSPSIIPFGADKGVFTCLKNSPFNY